MTQFQPESSSSRPVPPSETAKWRDLYDFYTDLLTAMKSRYQRQGRVFRWAPFRDIVIMLGAEAQQFVLVQNPRLFSAQKAWQENIGVLFRGGLLNRDGADHRQHRRLLMPAFRQEALNFYLETASPLIDQHIARWPLDCPDIYPRVKELTLQIAIRVFFGVTLESELKLYNKHITDVVAGSIALFKAPLIGLSYQRALRAREELVKLLRPSVIYRRHRPSRDMLGQLCQSRDEDGLSLEDDEIIDQMIFIMMAAHDTTASTLSSIFYELARHSSWQVRLRSENQAIAAKQLEAPEIPEALELYHYVIKETLRLNTPLKIIPRRSLEAFSFDSFDIEADQMIAVCPAFSHHMSEYWTKPEIFDPLRFAPGRAEHKQHPYAYMPFGGGIHLCLGQFFAEKFLSLILYKLIDRFNWKMPYWEDLRFQQVPIQVPKGRMPVRFSQRSAS